MLFRIADTFIDSLGKLTSQEQKVVKTTAFDLQMNPANPGMQVHKLDRARDHLLVTAVHRASEFLDDLMMSGCGAPSLQAVSFRAGVRVVRPGRERDRRCGGAG